MPMKADKIGMIMSSASVGEELGDGRRCHVELERIRDEAVVEGVDPAGSRR
jgi:hypothetical protein